MTQIDAKGRIWVWWRSESVRHYKVMIPLEAFVECAHFSKDEGDLRIRVLEHPRTFSRRMTVKDYHDLGLPTPEHLAGREGDEDEEEAGGKGKGKGKGKTAEVGLP